MRHRSDGLPCTSNPQSQWLDSMSAVWMSAGFANGGEVYSKPTITTLKLVFTAEISELLNVRE